MRCCLVDACKLTFINIAVQPALAKLNEWRSKNLIGIGNLIEIYSSSEYPNLISILPTCSLHWLNKVSLNDVSLSNIFCTVWPIFSLVLLFSVVSLPKSFRNILQEHESRFGIGSEKCIVKLTTSWKYVLYWFYDHHGKHSTKCSVNCISLQCIRNEFTATILIKFAWQLKIA